MFDVIVIGAGSGGLTAGLSLAGFGKKVLLIEKHKMGGDCTNYGCIPSKSLIKYGKDLSVMRNYGLEISNDWANKSLIHTHEKVNEVLSHESPEVLMSKYKTLKVIKGEAKFVDKCSIKVGEKTYKGKRIIIATGSEPRVVKIKGLQDKDMLTNKNVFDLKAIPKRLIIVGGGVIACELGEAFRNLGAEVHLVVRGSKLLKNNEPEISQMVQNDLEEKGVVISLNSEIDEVQDKKAIIDGEAYPFDKVLMAAGRIVKLDGLQLEKAGVDYDKKGIKVDSKNQTSTRKIYAIGDVASADKLTHNADHQGRNLVKNIIFPIWNNKSKAMPKVIFMENEVASIGLTYSQACSRFSTKEIFKIELDLKRSDRSITDGTKGKLILIVKGLKGKILGANICAPHAGEMIGVIGLAMDNKISLHKLSSSIYAYPTYSRLFKKAGDDFLRTLSAGWKDYLKHMIKIKGPKILGGIFWLSLIFAFFKYKEVYDKTNLQIAQDFFEYFMNADFKVALLYMTIYALRPIILFPATLLTVLSGALFGPIWGVLFTVIGENLSANLAYWMGRFLGADAISDDNTGLISKWKGKLKERSFESVLIMRLTYLPFDGVNYGCGILKVKWSQYALATLVGIMPGLVTFVVFGASIDFATFDPSMISFDPLLLIVSGGLFVTSLALAKFVRKKYNNTT